MAKRSLFIFLTALLMFGNVAMAASLPQPNKPARDNSIKTDLSEKEGQYSDSEQVRILVELDTEPAIEYANKKGVMFKDLPQSTKDNLHKSNLDKQKAVKTKIGNKKVKIKYKEEFTTVVNGFSAEVEYGEIEKIKEVDNVGKVHIVNEYERPEEKPDMIYSKELVQAQDAWRDYGYKGEGMVIGIIDTGIDPSHKDMVLSEETNPKFTEATVNLAVNKFGMDGKYYTEKVPYGYNYMDKNDTILDLGSGASMHGMHVAGTSAANGNEENGGIMGVAPEAQVLALKVFGNDPEFPSTYGDIYVKAIDDSINLGADVLNLSLGSTAGFVNADEPEQMAVKRATENGIVVAISAGNSAHFGNGHANPLASNPDIGVSGAPGISYDSLQVASLENSFLDLEAVTAVVGQEEEKYPFMSASSVNPTDIEKKPYGLVDAGLGAVSDFEGKDVQGKFALIQRGGITFVEKVVNAQNAGAAGAIIYNNTNGFISMATDGSIRIPQLAMLKTDGETLKAALAAGEEVSLTFEGDKTTAPNPEAGKMSSFTSWGVAPNLDFKPEITAPGGNIYSTLNDDKYGMMSGTSMAAPHVSGGAALVLQRVDEDFGYNKADRVMMAKNILMNTSNPLTDQGIVNTSFAWENPYSPRRQGAGVMQLHAALETPVIVTEKTKGEAKAALKEVGDTFSFTLVAKNYGEEDATYNVDANIQTDFAGWGELGYNANELEAQNLQNVTITVNGQDKPEITVPAGGTVEFEVTADISEAKVLEPGVTGDFETTVDAHSVFTNGFFVEGFVTLTDKNDTNPALTVPYVGFHGDWNAAPIIDDFATEEGSFYGYTGLVDNSNSYLGYNQFTEKLEKEHIAFSPNNDGVADQATPIYSLLRNAEVLEFNILDSNGKQLRKIGTQNLVTKHYFDGSGARYTLNTSKTWDGKINNKIAEGDYYYELKATAAFDGATAQSFKIPVKVDLTAPTVTASEQDQVISINARDNENGSGVAEVVILVNDKETAVLPGDTDSYELQEPLGENDELAVKAVDFAGNQAVAVPGPVFDDSLPSIHVLEPSALSIHDSKEVSLSGYVKDANGMTTLVIAGKTIELTYNEKEDRYDFNTTIAFEEDGIHEFTISGTSPNGKELAFNRTVIIDSTAPAVEVSGAPGEVGLSDPDPKVSVKVEDNFDELKVEVNGNEIFYQQFIEPFEMRPISKVINEVELPLEAGENVFEFTATDIAGNKMVKTVTINKVDTPAEPEVPEQPDASQGEVKVSGQKATLLVDGNLIEKDITDKDSDKVTLLLTDEVVADESVSAYEAHIDLGTAKKIASNKKAVELVSDVATIELTAKSFEEAVKKSDGKVKIKISGSKPTGIGKGSFLTDAYEYDVTYEKKGLFGKLSDKSISNLKENAKLAISLEGLADAQKAKAQSYRQGVLLWTKVGGTVEGEKLVFSTKSLGTFAVK